MKRAMRKIYYLLFLALILVGCANQNLNIANISNIHTAQLHTTPSVSIIVISDDQQEQLWYSLGESHKLERLPFYTGTAFQSVDQISISPDDKWIAVITVGEGHPLIAVYDLQSVLHGDDADYNREGKKGFTPLFVDPYPGYVEIIAWKGDNLMINSDVALDYLDKKERKVLDERYGSSVDGKFVWHIPTDRIVRQ